MKKWLLLLFAAFIINRVNAQQPSWGYQRAIDSILAQFPSDDQSPGYAVTIIQNGEIIYDHETGMANIKQQLPITLQSQFNIGSVTKQFTAMAILLLEESGKIKLSDEIHLYIPELGPLSSPVTLQQMLGHTSGIRDHFELSMMLNRFHQRSHHYPAMIEWLNQYPELNFVPGSNFAYSNANYMLLAMVVERVSGITYADFLQQNIFSPLQMDHSYVETGKTKEQHDGTTHYYYNKKFTKVKGPYHYQNGVGAVGVITTMHDLWLWDQNFYHNQLGNKSNKLIREMETSQLLTNGEETGYGYGLLTKSYHSNPVIEHSGGWGEYLTQIRRFPDKNLTVMICCNSMRYSPFLICDMICNQLVPYKPVHILQSPDAATINWKSLSGSFYTENNTYCKLVATDNRLNLLKYRALDTTVYHLQNISNTGNDHRFIDSTGTPVQVIQTGNNVVINWSGGNYFATPRQYVRTPDDTPATRAVRTSTYYDAETHKRIHIHYNEKKDQLKLFIFPKHFSLISAGGSTYTTDNYMYTLHFSEDTCTMGIEWLLHVTFEKK